MLTFLAVFKQSLGLGATWGIRRGVEFGAHKLFHCHFWNLCVHDGFASSSCCKWTHWSLQGVCLKLLAVFSHKPKTKLLLQAQVGSRPIWIGKWLHMETSTLSRRHCLNCDLKGKQKKGWSEVKTCARICFFFSSAFPCGPPFTTWSWGVSQWVHGCLCGFLLWDELQRELVGISHPSLTWRRRNRGLSLRTRGRAATNVSFILFQSPWREPSCRNSLNL